MYLHGEVLTGVNELNKQRKLVAELLVYLLANEQSLVFVDEFYEGKPFVNVVYQSAVYCHTLVTGNTANLPALADIRLSGEDALEGRYLVTTPDGGL